MASTTETRARKRQRRDEVKSRLRAAMLELAAERPFRELRIDEIARSAGLSRSAFYFYYRDKHDLLIEATAEVSESLYVQADRWWHGSGEPEELIRSALGGVAELWSEHAELLRMTTEVSTYDSEVRTFWRGLVQRFVDATAEHLRAEQAGGRVRAELDPERSAEALIWGAERLLYVYVGTGDRGAGEVVDALVPLWLSALYGGDRLITGS